MMGYTEISSSCLVSELEVVAMMFGEVLVQLLNERGMTISELSRRSGVRENTIRELAKCRSKDPTLTHAKRMADALGVTLQQVWDMMSDD